MYLATIKIVHHRDIIVQPHHSKDCHTVFGMFRFFLYIRFQLGNSFGNIQVKKTTGTPGQCLG